MLMSFDMRAVELRDWVAIVGVSYGIASDLIGGNRHCKANSVVGLVWGGIRRGWDWVRGVQPRPVVERSHPPLINYSYLIELGYRYRQRILETQKVDRVDVGLYGEHLILTVYKQPASDA